MLKRLLAKSKVGKVGKAQLKLTAIIIYYTLFGVMGLVTFTYFEANTDYRDSITEYILCESGALPDCALDFGTIDVVTVLSVIVVVTISLLPVLALLFSCNMQCCRKEAKKDDIS